MPILESLDKIDWASLSHAYGSAEDVPGLIRQRASTNPKEAEEAEGGLFGTIWHQGTVYEATAYAVPFLVELIERQMTHSREGLVLLLASISEGSSYLEVHKSHSHFASQDQDEIEAKLIKELEWKTRARDAVQRYAESYWTLLDDSSQRTTIPYLLSKLPAEAEHVRDRFPDRIATANDALFLASLLLGLAIASRTAPDAFARFTSFIHHDTPVVRLGAALGVLITGSSTSWVDKALDIYFEAFRHRETYGPSDHTWFWGVGDVDALLRNSIPLFVPSAVRALSGVLAIELPKLDEYDASSLAAESLHLCFDPAHLPRTKGELNDLQRSLLIALSRWTNVLYSDPLICGIQTALGLSREMRDLKAFMERSQ